MLLISSIDFLFLNFSVWHFLLLFRIFFTRYNIYIPNLKKFPIAYRKFFPKMLFFLNILKNDRITLKLPPKHFVRFSTVFFNLFSIESRFILTFFFFYSFYVNNGAPIFTIKSFSGRKKTQLSLKMKRNLFITLSITINLLIEDFILSASKQFSCNIRLNLLLLVPYTFSGFWLIWVSRVKTVGYV